MSRLISFVVLIASIVVIGFLFYRVMAPFLLPLFLAVLLVVIFYPLHRRIVEYCGNRERVAAAVTTLTVLLIVLLPIMLVVVVAAAEGSAVVKRLNLTELRDKVEHARDGFGFLRLENIDEIRAIDTGLDDLLKSTVEPNVPGVNEGEISLLLGHLDKWQHSVRATEGGTAEKFQQLRENIQSAELKELARPADVPEYRKTLIALNNEFHKLETEVLGGEFRAWLKELANPTEQEAQATLARLLNNTKGWLFALGGRTTALFGRTLMGLAIMVVAMYFFLHDGPAMVATTMRLSPLADHYERELLSEFESVSRAVVVGTLLSALAQGLIGGVGYYLAGFDSVFLLVLLTTALAMVPFVGAAAVWVPACLWLAIFEERLMAASLLAIYGVIAISSVDNIVKPIILHGQSSLHPLLALLSVLGGVNALGPIGILVGPMVVAFLQTLLNILHRELLQFDSESSTRISQTPARE